LAYQLQSETAMPGYFICKHCGNRIKKNPRL